MVLAVNKSLFSKPLGPLPKVLDNPQRLGDLFEDFGGLQ